MPPRCLLVDDSQAFLHAAAVLLEREGLTVAGVASSIAGALRQARALRPDLILVDIGLGDESGFELARLLAQDPQAGAADVILISTAAETDYQDLIQDSPAAGFLANGAKVYISSRKAEVCDATAERLAATHGGIRPNMSGIPANVGIIARSIT